MAEEIDNLLKIGAVQRCEPVTGFILNSVKMSIELPPEKRERIVAWSDYFLTNRSCKIREFARFIGILIAACPAVNWWNTNINKVFNDLKKDNFDLEIYTDASFSGWGATCKEEKAYGWWMASDREKHINILELKAIFHGLRCFCKTFEKCQHTNTNGSADNKGADQASRMLLPDTKWSLAQQAFDQITRTFGVPEIDLFASLANNKCDRYVSWQRDPGVEAVDAFTLSWQDLIFYAFPPFCLILRVFDVL
ncbi:hypothetical protein NQ315_006585 [Exocentrus adspersus]|uniref:Uncharacterized protein n=1 Tax=Exocentrus adspersus TaxID=1586481 RepID=A0AAV8VG08_9CUCU|nr:hypothetical protein NQ315_006585 [Exocentrus adspersus]